MVLSAIVDISSRKRLEERFRQVVESAPNAMVMISQRGMIEMVNAQAERVFGYRRATRCWASRSRCWCRSASARNHPESARLVLSAIPSRGRWAPAATCTA